MATEAIELIDVLWKGVPEKKRTWSKYAGYPEKLRDIYNNFEDIDVAAAFVAYQNNQFEDWYYGTLGRQAGKLNRVTGAATGGPTAIRRAQKGLTEDVENTNPLPQLTYDEETGQWGLSWPVFGW